MRQTERGNAKGCRKPSWPPSSVSSSPPFSDYETGQVRIHAGLLAALAHALHVSADELLGLTPTRATRGRSPTPDRRFLRRIERLHRLSRRDQQMLLGTIDAFLAKVS